MRELNPMPDVESTIWINAPIDRVWEVAQDNLSFPEFMEDVQSVVLVGRDGDRVVTDWVGIVSAFGLKVKWRQQDEWDKEDRTCAFVQLKGDYDHMAGTWKFAEENGGTRFDSHVNYVYNVPGLGALVGKVVHHLVVKNLEGVLTAIKARAESP